MIHAIVALLIVSSLYLSMGGALWATNFILCLLGLNVVLILYSIVFFAGFQKTLLMNAEKRIEELKAYAEKVDTKTLLLLRGLLLLCVWHVYMLGYAVFAGIAGTTVTISILVMLLRSIDMVERKEE